MLVAVHDDALRDITVHVLADAGFDVSDAASVGDALDEAVRIDPDIIVLDLGPTFDAEAFLREYRRRPRSRARIAVMSGGPPDRAVQTLGIDASVLKPFDVDELVASVNALMRTVGSHAN